MIINKCRTFAKLVVHEPDIDKVFESMHQSFVKKIKSSVRKG